MTDFFQEIFADVQTAERFRQAFPDLAAKYDTVAADALVAIAKFKDAADAVSLTIKRSQELVDEIRQVAGS
jgi:hypothetical protein